MFKLVKVSFAPATGETQREGIALFTKMRAARVECDKRNASVADFTGWEPIVSYVVQPE